MSAATTSATSGHLDERLAWLTESCPPRGCTRTLLCVSLCDTERLQAQLGGLVVTQLGAVIAERIAWIAGEDALSSVRCEGGRWWILVRGERAEAVAWILWRGLEATPCVIGRRRVPIRVTVAGATALDAPADVLLYTAGQALSAASTAPCIFTLQAAA